MKEHGVHYTPPELAEFLARRLFGRLRIDKATVSVLDPAAGDGELLGALAVAAGPDVRRFELLGIDRDELAVGRARARLQGLGAKDSEMLAADFLNLTDGLCPRRFDAVISNPPYVRTQLLGASTAQEFARRFDLAGRVDLYQVFVGAMTERLRPGGILGLVCSNRFLSVQSGVALRELFTRDYELLEIYDLGDTKLFSAAVLPAIVIARRVVGGATSPCRFTRVYESKDIARAAETFPSVVAALSAATVGSVAVAGQVYEIEQGDLARGATAGEPWRLTHDAREKWLATVAAHTEQTFADVAPIRVGIKTTADSVFIRESWEDLPAELQPEPELVRRLLTHHISRRWQALEGSKQERTVLYPHVVTGGRRATIDLEAYPRARAYLGLHRERLSGRPYVARAGRQWFEIWVPQQPGDWGKRKVVFPDIAESPCFFLDTTGAVVNGDCYWMPLDESVPAELASLILAVGNSSFAVEFYDAVCGNKLYAGRRRFITQYVKRFPLPRLKAAERADIHSLVGLLRGIRGDKVNEREELEARLDVLVRRAFGLSEEIRR